VYVKALESSHTWKVGRQFGRIQAGRPAQGTCTAVIPWKRWRMLSESGGTLHAAASEGKTLMNFASQARRQGFHLCRTRKCSRLPDVGRPSLVQRYSRTTVLCAQLSSDQSLRGHTSKGCITLLGNTMVLSAHQHQGHCCRCFPPTQTASPPPSQQPYPTAAAAAPPQPHPRSHTHAHPAQTAPYCWQQLQR
jgi:hypothetical protein